MVIKLSDYILEQSISTASVDDIEYERIKAELEVATAIAESYVKKYNMGLFQEVEADVPKDMPNKQDLVQPQASQVQDVDETRQKRWQDQLRSLGVEFESEKHDPSLNPYIQKYYSYYPNETIIGTYTDSDGTPFIIAADNELNFARYDTEHNAGRNIAMLRTVRINKNNGQLYEDARDTVYLRDVNMSDVTRDNLIRLTKYWKDARQNDKNFFDERTFNKNANAANKIEYEEIGAKKYRDEEREMLAHDSLMHTLTNKTNADPKGTVSKNMIAASVNALIFAIVSMMGRYINQLIAMEKSRRKYGKHVEGLTKTLNSMHVYLNDVLLRIINDRNSFNETNFSQMVSNYNTMLNQAIQVFNQGASEKAAAFDKESVSANEVSMAQGVDQLDDVLHSKVLLDNYTLIKTIMKNRGMIETKLSQLPPEATSSIIESTNRYKRVIVPAMNQIQAQLKQIQSDPTAMKPQQPQNPTISQQTQPPQQQKKPGELDAGNGMMMQQPPQG